ncbi:MAG: GAF domain-containing protein, partial [Terriglobia bacterium]
GRSESAVDLRRVSHFQIVLDLFSLVLLVHFTGGIESPLWFFFIFPVAASVVLLSPRLTFAYSLTSVALYVSLVLLEVSGLVPHIHAVNDLPPELHFGPGNIVGSLMVFGAALLFSGYFSFSVTEQLKDRQEWAATLLEISRRLRSHLSVKSVVDDVYTRVAPLIGAEASMIFLLDDDQKLVGQADGDEADLGEKERLYGLNSAYEATKTCEIIPSYFSQPDSPEDGRGRFRPRILVSVPLKASERILGALNIVLGKDRKLNRKERDFLLSAGDRIALSIHNSSLFESVERKMSEMSVLYDVGRTTTSSLDLDDILKFSLDSVLNIVGAGTGSIMLFDEGSKALKTVANRGNGHHPRDVEESLSGGRGLVSDDKSSLSVPLCVQDRVIGAINVADKETGLFGHSELDLLTALGSGIGMAIENGRLYESRKKEAKEVALINEASRVISSSLNIDQIYSALVSELEKMIHFDRVSISLLDETGENVEAFAITNKGEIVERRVAKPTEVCCASWVSEHKTSLLRPDIREEPHFQDDKIIIEEGIRTCFSLPLMVKDRVLGTFCLYNKKKDAYDDHDLTILKPIAEQLAIAIENAKLYDDLRMSLVRSVESLAKAVDAKDSYTAGHSDKVTQYALALAREFGFNSEALKGIEIAAKLHDIGKIGVSENLLQKKAPLTGREREMMRRHPLIGTSILTPLNFSQEILDWIQYHHEQPDGGGYPNAVSSPRLPLGASILKVADAFEAMTSDRPYRKALGVSEALLELTRYSNTQFDARVVASFARLVKNGELDLQAARAQ